MVVVVVESMGFVRLPVSGIEEVAAIVLDRVVSE